MLEGVRDIVHQESPSADKPRLDRLATSLAGRFDSAGCAVTSIPNLDGGDHLSIYFPDGTPGRARKPTLILCHYDTVWPAGIVDTWPLRVENGRATGPGVFDMKSSIVMAEFAFRAIRALDLTLPRPVTLLITSDEEIGSPTSRALIEETARSAEYVLVLEPALAGGALKTARKGVGHFDIEIEGKAAHAGIEPEKGVSAISEMARQVIQLDTLGDLSKGTTVNVGVVHGGTRSNVVPARASMEVDVRILSLAEARRIEGAIRAIRPQIPGISLTIKGGINRPPMERTDVAAALFAQAQTIGATIGLDLKEGMSGGGSDGNFTSALGIPTLDGLGPLGDGAHASHEYIEVDSLVERTALLTCLLLQVGEHE